MVKANRMRFLPYHKNLKSNTQGIIIFVYLTPIRTTKGNSYPTLQVKKLKLDIAICLVLQGLN